MGDIRAGIGDSGDIIAEIIGKGVRVRLQPILATAEAFILSGTARRVVSPMVYQKEGQKYFTRRQVELAYSQIHTVHFLQSKNCTLCGDGF